MKINRQDLLKILEKPSSIIKTNQLVPEYSHFIFYDSMIYVSNGNILVSSKSNLTTIEDNFQIPSKLFLTFLKNLKEDSLNLTVEESKLIIETGSIVSSFAIIAIDTRPESSSLKNAKKYLDIDRFIKGLTFCRQVIAEESNEVLLNIHITNDHMFSTDRYRILKVKLQETFDGVDYSIPVSFVDMLLKYQKQIMEIYYTSKEISVKFKDGSTVFSSVFLEEYRDVSSYFPDPIKDFYIPLEFKTDLSEVIFRHSEYLKDMLSMDRKTKFSIEQNICTLTTSLNDQGNMVEILELVTSVEPCSFSLNTSYLTELFKNCSKFRYYGYRNSFLYIDNDMEFLMQTIQD